MASEEEQVVRKLAGLGYSEADAQTLAAHFLEAERRGKQGHGLSRVEWLTGIPGLDPSARPERFVHQSTYERWDGNGALGYLTLAAIVEAQLASPPPEARLVVAQRCFPTGMLGYWARKLADRGLVAASDRDVAGAAGPSRRRAEADRHEPPCDRDPELGREAARRGRLDGRGHLRRRHRGSGDGGAARPVRRGARAQGVRTRARACSCLSTRWWPSPATAQSCSSHAPGPTRCRRYEPAPLACACPVIVRKRASS